MWKMTIHSPFGVRNLRGHSLRTLNRQLEHLDWDGCRVPASLIRVYRKNRDGRWFRFSVNRWRKTSFTPKWASFTH